MHKIKKCVISNVALICFGLGLASCNNSRNTSGEFLNKSSLKANDLSENEEKIFSAIKYSLYAFEKPETVELAFVSENLSFIKIKFLGNFDGYVFKVGEFYSNEANYRSFWYREIDSSDYYNDWFYHNEKEEPFWFFVDATNDLIGVTTSYGYEETMEKILVADYSVSVPKINEELDKLRNL